MWVTAPAFATAALQDARLVKSVFTNRTFPGRGSAGGLRHNPTACQPGVRAIGSVSRDAAAPVARL